MKSNIDYIVNRSLINHCAPVLLGCKPAALFTVFSIECLVCLKKELNYMLDIKVFRNRKKSILIMVYKQQMLEKLILNEKVRHALSLLGYSESFSIDSYLSLLEYRFNNTEDFPHEIGLFLGYPPEDVLGFINNCGMDYKYCGLWKVYGDEEKSKKRFDKYKHCRECLRIHLENGGSIKNFNIKNNNNGGFYE